MEDLQHLLDFGAVAMEIVLLWLQLRAYLRHRHLSFLLLSVSTISGLLYFGLYSAPYIVPAAASYYHILIILSAGFFAAQVVLGIWGTAALFGSYRALAAASTSRSERA